MTSSSWNNHPGTSAGTVKCPTTLFWKWSSRMRIRRVFHTDGRKREKISTIRYWSFLSTRVTYRRVMTERKANWYLEKVRNQRHVASIFALTSKMALSWGPSQLALSTQSLELAKLGVSSKTGETGRNRLQKEQVRCQRNARTQAHHPRILPTFSSDLCPNSMIMERSGPKLRLISSIRRSETWIFPRSLRGESWMNKSTQWYSHHLCNFDARTNISGWLIASYDNDITR